MSPYNLVLAALATFRLAYLISQEEGPLDVFLIIREWFENRAMKNPTRAWVSVAAGIACPYCTGVYIAFFNLVLMSYFSSVATNVYIYGFAIAGLQTILQSWKDNRE